MSDEQAEGFDRPGVWIKVVLTVQCALCGSVLEVEATNPHADDLDEVAAIDVECPTCSQAPGVVCHSIPVVILVGDQVDEATAEDESDGEDQNSDEPTEG